MTGAVATQRKERSEISSAKARRERATAPVQPEPRAEVAVNGAVLKEEAARFVRPQAESPTRLGPAANGDAGTESGKSGQTEEEARLLGEYNLYNG